MAKRKLASYRFRSGVFDCLRALQGFRKQTQTDVVVDAIRRLYLVELQKRQKGLMEDQAAIQNEIKAIENRVLYASQMQEIAKSGLNNEAKCVKEQGSQTACKQREGEGNG
jgi:hypothetical protein